MSAVFRWSVALLPAAGIALTLVTPRPAEPPADRPAVSAAGGFLSSDSCRACHPGNYASWHVSFHRTMTQPARVANVNPDMHGLELALDGRRLRVERRGDAYFVHSDAADEPREIVLLTGSHHQQNFWLATGDARAVEPFPFGWLIAEQMWAPLTDTFLCPPDVRSGRAEGVWNTSCLNCHVTQGRPLFTADGGFDSRAVELGIACESCHGEGRAHVEKHRNPLARYLAHATSGGDATIANPARMSGPESTLVCGQCHSVWAFHSDDAVAAWNDNGTRFRPGDSALPGRFVVQPASAAQAEQLARLDAANPDFLGDTFWPDGMVRITGREYNALEASPCFQGGDFSCLSCHEMHPDRHDSSTLASWAARQLGVDGANDHACVQCHAPIAADLTAHTRHRADSPGSRCYNCHMPHTTYGLMRALRSHQVTSPTVRESLEAGRPNACNLCHLDRSLEWTANQLATWQDEPAPASFSRDQAAVATGALWMLKGDAAQRALVAWSMGWEPARAAQPGGEASWFTPYLATALNDPYSAVRFIAWKALQKHAGFEHFSFTYTASEDATFAAASSAYQLSLDLRRRFRLPSPPPASLLDESGRFQEEPYNRLLDARDQRRVFLVE